MIDLRRRLGEPHQEGVDPEDVRHLAAEHFYRAELSWSESGSAGCFDAALVRQDVADQAPISTPLEARTDPGRSGSSGTNNPLQSRLNARLIADLKDYLSKLPDYMVPEAFVVAETLPLTQA